MTENYEQNSGEVKEAPTRKGTDYNTKDGLIGAVLGAGVTLIGCKLLGKKKKSKKKAKKEKKLNKADRRMIRYLKNKGVDIDYDPDLEEDELEEDELEEE